MQGQRGFWNVEERLKELSAEGDPLLKLSAMVDFELFRPVLRTSVRRGDPAKCGRPGFDPVLKFRMLVLQAMHGLSLHQTEYLVRDRLGRAIDAVGYMSMGGQIIDATPVAALRQRNKDGEKVAIRAGQILESWKDKPASLRHNDRDARRTVKESKSINARKRIGRDSR